MNDEMKSETRIAIIGDFEAERLSHRATNEALLHGADALHIAVSVDWIPTLTLETDAGRIKLKEYDGIFCAPGGPYKSMNGVLEAIRLARELRRPFLGT